MDMDECRIGVQLPRELNIISKTLAAQGGSGDAALVVGARTSQTAASATAAMLLVKMIAGAKKNICTDISGPLHNSLETARNFREI